MAREQSEACPVDPPQSRHATVVLWIFRTSLRTHAPFHRVRNPRGVCLVRGRRVFREERHGGRRFRTTKMVGCRTAGVADCEHCEAHKQLSAHGQPPVGQPDFQIIEAGRAETARAAPYPYPSFAKFSLFRAFGGGRLHPGEIDEKNSHTTTSWQQEKTPAKAGVLPAPPCASPRGNPQKVMLQLLM